MPTWFCPACAYHLRPWLKGGRGRKFPRRKGETKRGREGGRNLIQAPCAFTEESAEVVCRPGARQGSDCKKKSPLEASAAGIFAASIFFIFFCSFFAAIASANALEFYSSMKKMTEFTSSAGSSNTDLSPFFRISPRKIVFACARAPRVELDEGGGRAHLALSPCDERNAVSMFLLETFFVGYL